MVFVNIFFFFNFSIFLSIFRSIKTNPSGDKKSELCGDEYIQLNESTTSYNLLNTYKAKNYLNWSNLTCDYYVIDIAPENSEFYLSLRLEENSEISKNQETENNPFLNILVFSLEDDNKFLLNQPITKIINFKDLNNNNNKYELKIAHFSMISIDIGKSSKPFKKYLTAKIEVKRQESSNNNKKLILTIIIAGSIFLFILAVIIIICCSVKYLKRKKLEKIAQIQQAVGNVAQNNINDNSKEKITYFEGNPKLSNITLKMYLLNGKLFSETYENCSIKDKFNECSICIERFKDRSIVVVTHCNHLFHFHCLETWINKNNQDAKCPNCNCKLNYE